MYNKLTDKQYNITIGIILLWGFLVNTIMCVFFQDTFCNLNPTMVLIGYFVVALAGIGMSEFSDNPIVSFIGYNLVVLPVGVVLSICLKDYYMSSIVQAFILTTLITIVLIIVSSIKPEIFLSMGKPLFHVEIRRQRMKVILQYTDCMSDDKNIFGVLAKNNVEVIKTKQKQFSIYPLVTIRVKDTNTLNKILEQLNEKSVYGVRIVKVKSDKSFIEKLKMLFK